MKINGYEITERMIHTGQLEEALDGAQWGIYRCQVELPNGELRDGYVQAGFMGEGIALESLEMEE